MIKISFDEYFSIKIQIIQYFITKSYHRQCKNYIFIDIKTALLLLNGVQISKELIQGFGEV